METQTKPLPHHCATKWAKAEPSGAEAGEPCLCAGEGGTHLSQGWHCHREQKTIICCVVSKCQEADQTAWL